MIIAGHTFVDTSTGRSCVCGQLWTRIAATTRDDIGKSGIAHCGTLNEAEYQQIEGERERIWVTVWSAAGSQR